MTPALLRARLEAALGERFPAALSPAARPAPELVSTGVAEVDALAGGLPRGALTEICGPASSGRTSLLLAVLAEATRREEACALVDASDAFDPASAAAAGVELARLLWVRCNGPMTRWPDDPIQITRSPDRSIIRSLEQALKAADLLLQAGGFGLVALDLGDVPPALACRVPLTSWFRFRRAVERTPTVLLLLEQESCARTCASLVLRLQNQQSAFSSQHSANPSVDPTPARLLRGLKLQVEVVHSRLRKLPHAAGIEFESCATWAG
jgi:recombination protein RecA